MMINDWDGTETVYGHMSSFVRTSGCVSAGETIARIGSAGDATGPHLHFEVRVGGVPVDPVPFLAQRGVRI
jgi:murein DD-endopeptidase MepM/ murein hydrolase activator NlpD